MILYYSLSSHKADFDEMISCSNVVEFVNPSPPPGPSVIGGVVTDPAKNFSVSVAMISVVGWMYSLILFSFLQYDIIPFFGRLFHHLLLAVNNVDALGQVLVVDTHTRQSVNAALAALTG